jgi:tape measure domain-containing protein
MTDERIVIEIDADTGEVIKQFKKLSSKAKDSGKKTGKNFSKGFSSGASKALDGIKGKLISLGAVAAGVFATSVAVRAAADFEKIQTRLETLTGSASAAGVVFEELKTLSASTPFQLGDIANASAKLISFGFSAGSVADQVKEIGEVAAGSGAEIGELSLIFGQVAAAGKLTGERLLQLQERAIPIGPAIAKSMGVAESSVRDLVKEGKVTADEFQKAFTSMTVEGGLFAGSLEKQSRTLSGVFSTLADNAKIFSSEIGNALSPAIIESATTLIKVFQEAGAAFKGNAPIISENLKKIAEVLLITPSKFWLNFLSGSGTASLQATNQEIEKLQKRLGHLKSDLEVQKDNSFSKFFGIDDDTRLSIINTEQEIKKLKATRDALIKSTGGGPDESAAVKAELEAKAVAKAEALKEAEREKARQVSLQNLGIIGLAKQEIIEQQLAAELEAIGLAEETKALNQSEADQRRVVVLNSANAQILALQKTAQKAGVIVDKTAKDINKSMNQTLGNGVANGIETITKAVMQGENVFKAFGSMVLDMMADMAIQMGKIFVATGVAQLALFSSPGASILAGAALIAAGTVAKSIFGGGESSSGATVGGGIASGGNFVAGGIEDSPAVAQAEEREEPNTEVSVVIQGDVLDSDQSGIRIVDIINNAFEKDGVVIKGASFA